MRTMKYVIFDLDGTLLDTMEIWDNIGDDFLKENDITPPDNLREILKTMSLKQSAKYFKETFSLPLSESLIMDRINKMAEDKYNCEVSIKPYALAFLEKLKAKNIRMCIATATDNYAVVTVLKRLGILDYFEFIITCTDVDCGKDNPKIYLRAAEKFGCQLDEIVVFEDALHCIKTAKNAGFYVVGVQDASAEQDQEQILELSDHYIHSFDEMEDFQ